MIAQMVETLYWSLFSEYTLGPYLLDNYRSFPTKYLSMHAYQVYTDNKNKLQ